MLTPTIDAVACRANSRAAFPLDVKIDVAFAFGNFELDHPAFTHFSWGASTPAEREVIHKQMVTAFRGFIESNDPDHYDAGLGWKRWNAKGDEKQF